MGPVGNFEWACTLIDKIIFKKLTQRPAKFVSTSFRPLLLASGASPFRSAHIAGLLFLGESGSC